MSWKVPLSFKLLLITAIVFLLQMHPATGLILFLVAAPWWSLITINAGFFIMIIESLTGMLNRYFVIIPIIWFGGYTLATAWSHYELAQIGAAFARENAGHSFQFSSSINDLLIDSESDAELSGLAGKLVSTHELPVVYQIDKDHHRGAVMAYRLGSSKTCTRLLHDETFRKTGGLYSLQKNYAFDKEPCVYFAPERPQKPIVIVTSIRSEMENFFTRYTTSRMKVQIQGEVIDGLNSGFGKALTWYPQPHLGCFLNSGAQKWDCFTEFGRENTKVLKGGDNVALNASEVLGRALNLKYMPSNLRQMDNEIN